ncbi:GTPase Era [Orrella sp. 11846]|uniref:GTPase Era n=1 Tax=Orrella sp. 11846 TaxID=3409913 RepID=UPI003B5B2643
MNTSSVTRCGFVAVVGRPNVGKSTLMNTLIGAKISIVSRKAQTTRHRIHGVLTTDDTQFIFVDTPGFQTRHGGAMNRMMNRVVTQTLSQVDVILFVVEAGRWGPADEKLLELFKPGMDVVLVLNKVDAVKNRETLLPFIAQVSEKFDFSAIVPVSAQSGLQLDALLQEVSQHLPQGEAIYEEDAITDRPVRFLVAEMIREKIFRLVGDELPYGCTVVIEEWDETDARAVIKACVVVERESHRPILLGAKGVHMKRIATEARQEIERLLEKSVHLEVFIKVRKGWSDREASLRDLGYE